MSTAQNKSLSEKYNKEVVEGGNMDLFRQMATPDFINHSAGEGMPDNIDGMIYFFSSLLHPALSDLKVSVHDTIADEQKVATRKTITGRHTGELMGIPATGKEVAISVIDILSIEGGKIRAHWGENNFPAVLQSLQAK